ncbi:hypothetical protein [Curtobacterium sp. S6]|uniref:hypothetical protein n=1 Tax=Curtobacterium sp. S6 TaxID=1479623 RepID=UPI0004AAF2E3|nr:hypothetical protein [Curtobacterium sp. S6]
MGTLIYNTTTIIMGDRHLAQLREQVLHLAKHSQELITIKAPNHGGTIVLFYTPGVPLEFRFDSTAGEVLTDGDRARIHGFFEESERLRTAFVFD